jgi:hypothetical protein
MDRQKKQRAWIRFDELAERYGRNIGIAEGYEQLKHALIDGKFERNGRSRVRYFHPWVTTAKMTTAGFTALRSTGSTFGAPYNASYLARAYAPRLG